MNSQNCKIKNVYYLTQINKKKIKVKFMEIQGSIKLIQETESGTSKSGKEWAKRTIVVTTNDKYPQDLPIDFMGDKISQIDNFQVGNPVNVSVNIRGSEYNGKYYTSISGWKIANYIGDVNNTTQNPAREKEEDVEVIDLPF
jgi:hypothetical protein